jgi:hypothetical protein
MGLAGLAAIVTVPNGIRREFRRALLVGGRNHFCGLFRKILDNFNKSLKGVKGAAPWVEVVQRRYPSWPKMNRCWYNQSECSSD